MRLAKFGEWTSVDDELPELWSTVLIADVLTDVNVAQLCADGNRKYFQLERTTAQNDPIDIQLEQVTHWMPLPDAPTPPEAA
jgi:hypothetical protein